MAYVFNTQNHPQMSVSCLEEIYKKYITIAKAEYPTMFKEKYYQQFLLIVLFSLSVVETSKIK